MHSGKAIHVAQLHGSIHVMHGGFDSLLDAGSHLKTTHETSCEMLLL